MISYWTFEKALRQAGEERGWTYMGEMGAWTTRTGLRLLLVKRPTRVRVKGRIGGEIIFGTLPPLLEYIGEEPLPRGELERRRRSANHRRGTNTPDRMEEAR